LVIHSRRPASTACAACAAAVAMSPRRLRGVTAGGVAAARRRTQPAEPLSRRPRPRPQPGRSVPTARQAPCARQTRGPVPREQRQDLIAAPPHVGRKPPKNS
jgi:hypothetical protein